MTSRGAWEITNDRIAAIRGAHLARIPQCARPAGCVLPLARSRHLLLALQGAFAAARAGVAAAFSFRALDSMSAFFGLALISADKHSARELSCSS